MRKVGRVGHVAGRGQGGRAFQVIPSTKCQLGIRHVMFMATQRTMHDLDAFATDATVNDSMYMYVGYDPCGSVPVCQGRNHTRVSHASVYL
eukprot:4924155-Karenia_brevis.AAC.2